MKILVIGESCMDIFEYGTCTRLNPEAPTPIFVSKMTVSNRGMAGNVHNNLKSLEHFEVEALHQTNGLLKKRRYVDESSNYILLRVDDDRTPEALKLHREIVERVRSADAVVVSDYNKGFLDKTTLAWIAQNSVCSFLDTKKSLETWWASKFTWIKINEKEFNNPLHEENFLREHSESIIVTLGGQGARIGETIYHGQESEVRDVVGAGDSFLAGFAAAYLKTQGDLEKSMNFANLAGSHAVKKKGVADLSELKGIFVKL